MPYGSSIFFFFFCQDRQNLEKICNHPFSCSCIMWIISHHGILSIFYSTLIILFPLVNHKKSWLQTHSFLRSSIIYQLDKEFYKLIVLIRTILVTNNRKQSNSSWSKMLRCVTDLKGRSGARAGMGLGHQSPAGLSLRLLPVHVFIFFFYLISFLITFSLARSARMERKHGCWLDLCEFFIYSFSHLESDRLALFSVTKSLAKDSEWFSVDQMLTLEWICWPEQALGGDAPDLFP